MSDIFNLEATKNFAECGRNRLDILQIQMTSTTVCIKYERHTKRYSSSKKISKEGIKKFLNERVMSVE